MQRHAQASADNKAQTANSFSPSNEILFQMLTYDFIARHGKVIGHIQPSTKFDNLLKQVQNIFLKEWNIEYI